MSEVVVADALVVGGGLAGLYAVLHLPADWDVIVVEKGTDPDPGSSPLAQGGMAVAMHPDDSPALHASDTLMAGAGACDAAAVSVLVEGARGALEDLVALGCRFDRASDGSWDLNREGGQTVPRSVHRADATGREIMRGVVPHARRRARRLAGAAVRLIVNDARCGGARVLTEGGHVDVLARAVILATGGCGALYASTTNPPGATGDAVALAYEAGAEVADVELVQFHPTALEGPGTGLRRVLLTEALRGEGAVVVDGAGRRFLFDDDPRGELAPRDVVARAIAARGGALLDARPIGGDRLASRFPNVRRAVLASGYDLAAEPVPVAPAAHYFLGGARVDSGGRTSVPGLYAVGECAATGVHGANRMAGNSLAEAVVFGRIVARAVAADEGPRPRVPPASADAAFGDDPEGAWTELRVACSAGAGLVRDRAGLARALDVLETLRAKARSPALRLAARTASLICVAALRRDESRGVHFRSDAPRPSASWEGRHVVLSGARGA